MPPGRRTTTVLFLDIVGSTHVASELGDARFRVLIARFNRIVEAGLRRHRGREEDRAGDGFFASFPEPAQAIACACQLTEDVRELGIEIRAGIHTGGTESIDGKTQGIAVVIGARVMSLAGPAEVLVTSTTKELTAGAGFSFEDASAHELKGVEGTWQVWAIVGIDGRPLPGPAPAAEAADRLRQISAVQPRRGRGRHAVIAALVAAVIVGTGVIVFSADPEEPRRRTEPTSPAPGTILQIDPASDRVSLEVSVRPLHEARTLRHTVHPLVVGQGGIWLIRRDQLIHLDPLDGDERGRPAIGRGNPVSVNVASGYDSIWLMTDRELLRVHPATREVKEVASLERGPHITWTTDVTTGARYVWVGTSDGELLRVDPRTGRATRKEDLSPIDSITAGPTAVWTSDVLEGAVTRYDPRSMRREGTIPIAGGVDAMAVADEGLWVMSRATGQVTLVEGDEAGPPIRVGGEPTSIAVGLGAIWVGDGDGVLRRIDAETRLVEQITIGSPIRTIAIDDDAGTIWIDVR